MKIFYDHQTFSLQSYGGISRYFVEIIKKANEFDDIDAYLPLVYSNNIHLHESNFNVKTFLNKHELPKRKLIYHINKLYNVKKILTNNFDVFHATYYDTYHYSLTKKRPTVVTFFDMIHEKYLLKTLSFPYIKKLVEQKKFLIHNADKIIAISQNTKDDILNIYNVNPEKIDVIHLGASLQTINNKIENELIKEPYFLFVGNRDSYKNFVGLIKSIYPVLIKNKIKLLCAGGGQFNNEEKNLINSLKLEKLVEYVAINDDVLVRLYKKAVAFIFPSFYEGFGIPILEAFSCECPCILSNIKCFHEIADQSALYFDPSCNESIQNSVENILYNENLRKDLINKGNEQLLKFSWLNTYNKTVELYKSFM